jgi:hypothetical protein
MLKLTQGDKRRPIWVAVQHIVAVSDGEYSGASITPITGYSIKVHETPEEIIQLIGDNEL